jgi:hypothetical protein
MKNLRFKPNLQERIKNERAIAIPAAELADTDRKAGRI